jgi:hypothetical protein
MISKFLMVCGLMVGGLMFATDAAAQSPTSHCTGAKPASGHACCANKTASVGGSTTSTSANGGSVAKPACAATAAASKTSCTNAAAKTSCNHGAATLSSTAPASAAAASKSEGTK